MLCKKENQTKIYLCIADPCGLKKKSDDHGLCKNDIPTLNFTRAYRPRHITIGSNSFKIKLQWYVYSFASIFSRDISGVSDKIYIPIKYVISNKIIFVIVMSIKVFQQSLWFDRLPALVCWFEVDHLASLVLFWIKNQITLLNTSLHIF